MKKFNATPTALTPEIKGDTETGLLSIRGTSFPEDSATYYAPLLEWVESFYKSNTDKLLFHIDLEYMNSATGIVISQICRRMKQLNHEKIIEIVWNYETGDVDMKEFGLDLKALYGDIIKLRRSAVSGKLLGKTKPVSAR